MNTGEKKLNFIAFRVRIINFLEIFQKSTTTNKKNYTKEIHNM